MWDGIKRRAADNGDDSPDILLARIDENVKFLKSGAEITRIALSEHQKLDDRRFAEVGDKVDRLKLSLNKSIWMVSGGAAVLIFLINLFFKH